MRYIAFLRGINISGKNKVPMAELKALLENLGYAGVKTLLNSGNAAFDAEETACAALAAAIREALLQQFGLEIPVFVLPREELAELLTHAPQWWDNGDPEQYNNLIFLLDGYDAAETAALIGSPSAEIERVALCGNAIFWSFVTAKHQKANWWKKTAAPGIGERLTVRTAGTCKKVALL